MPRIDVVRPAAGASSPGLASGFYYFASTPGHSFAEGNWLGLNQTHMVWLPVGGNGATLSRIGLEVVTGAAGSTHRLAVYADNGGVPGALLVDAGNVDSSAVGFKEITISCPVSGPGVWLACAPSGSAESTIRMAFGNMSIPMSVLTGGQNMCLRGTSLSAGAFVTSMTVTGNRDGAPRLFVKVA